MLYKDGGIVEKILTFVDYRRNKRFMKSVMRYIGKRDRFLSTWGIHHNGHLYDVRIREVV